MPTQRNEKRFRVTARDNNGDIFAFETDNRERARIQLEKLQQANELHDFHMEISRWV